MARRRKPRRPEPPPTPPGPPVTVEVREERGTAEEGWTFYDGDGRPVAHRSVDDGPCVHRRVVTRQGDYTTFTYTTHLLGADGRPRPEAHVHVPPPPPIEGRPPESAEA